MKKKFLPLLLLSATVTISLVSCDKDNDKDAHTPPHIYLNSGAAYVSGDATLARDTTVTVSVSGAKSEGNDILTKYTVTRNYDSGTDTTIVNQTLSAAQADTFYTTYQLTTRNTAGTEKYTFTLVDKDGVINSKNLTVTVH